MRPPPNRGRIMRAIELTRRDRGEALVIDDISVDAVFMLIKWVDYRRERREADKEPYEIYALVKESTQFFSFDPARTRIYNLVVMRYYSLLSQLLARIRSRQSTKPTRDKIAA